MKIIFTEKIANFNNFTIDIDDDWITLEDKEGHFYGQYHQSKNKRYIVIYTDAHGEVDKKGKEKMISGQVYLIEDKKKILWQKDIARPNAAFVTDEGVTIVIDWISFSGELSGKIYFFNKNGEKLFEEKFSSNIGGQNISKEGKEIIITTCFPENALYLFGVKEKKLLKKVENNTQQRPLTTFNFNNIKNYIIQSPEFNQEAYDLQKQKEGKKIQEEKERIESLKKKKISDLNYEELVELGSIYAGDFYGNFGEPGKALKYIIRAIELKKEKPQPYVLKLAGFCYEKLEDYKNAIKYYGQSLKRYPQYKKSVVIDHLEFCKLKLNKKTKEDWTAFIIKKREKGK